MYVGFIDNSSLNAFAAHRERIYVVGLYAGMPISLLRLFTHLMLCPDVFPEIGNPSQQAKGLSLDAAHLVPLNYRKMNYVDLLGLPRACDSSRIGLGVILGLLACQFVIVHELMHVMRGHVDLLNTRTGESTLLEHRSVPFTGVNTAVMQALEIDADDGAVFALTGWLHGNLAHSYDRLSFYGLQNSASVSNLPATLFGGEVKVELQHDGCGIDSGAVNILGKALDAQRHF